MGHFELWGYPTGHGNQPLQLREVTIVAEAALLRRLAEFFAHEAARIEEHGSAYGHEHFCDFAGASRADQGLADIIVFGRNSQEEK